MGFSSQQHGAAIVAFVAGMAATSLFFHVSSRIRRRMDCDDEAEYESEKSDDLETELPTAAASGQQKRGPAKGPKKKPLARKQHSSSPPKHKWPWESRAKSRSSSMESEPSSASNGMSPPLVPPPNSASSRASSAPSITGKDQGPPDNHCASTNNAKKRITTKTTTSQKSKHDNLCIGSIFGLDVGGTLAKLVYFEAEDHGGFSSTATTSSSSSSSSSSSLDGCDQPEDESRYILLQKRASMSKVPSSARKEWKPLLATQEHYQHLHYPHTNSVPSKLNTMGDDLINHPPPVPSSSSTSSSSSRKLVRTLSSSFHELDPLEHANRATDDNMTNHHHHHHNTNKKQQQQQHRRKEALSRFYAVAKTLSAEHDNASFYSSELGGAFHFIQFETKHMDDAMELIRHYNLHMNIHEMGGTGGGAHKYAELWKVELAIEMKKQDELDSLVAGMQFVLNTVVGECYTYRPLKDKPNVDDWSQKIVQRHEESSFYPYLVVIIGTGVSVLRVDGPRQYERVSGSTIGGGTFFGLIRLLTDADKFDDGMKLAERGDPSKIDMLVGDIYGSNSDALEKLGLPADLVASSFGKLVAKDDPASGLNQEDIARALLLMITNNIGQVAHLNAKLHKTKRIYFVGNFLRHNEISQRRLSYAINYWSQGEKEALFLKHEGYFGALGAFLLSQRISVSGSGIRQWKQQTPRK